VEARLYIADLLKRFLAGNTGPYEFDDFISSPENDPELDAIRIRLARLPDEEPSGDPGEYTNDRGREVICSIIKQLEEG
jgi:hypothetical protein